MDGINRRILECAKSLAEAGLHPSARRLEPIVPLAASSVERRIRAMRRLGAWPYACKDGGGRSVSEEDRTLIRSLARPGLSQAKVAAAFADATGRALGLTTVKRILRGSDENPTADPWSGEPGTPEEVLARAEAVRGERPTRPRAWYPPMVGGKRWVNAPGRRIA